MPYSNKAKYTHKRITPPSKFDKRSFRVKKKKKGCVLIVVGCPKGKWNAKRKRCKVGMRIQKKMYSKKCYPKKRGD